MAASKNRGDRNPRKGAQWAKPGPGDATIHLDLPTGALVDDRYRIQYPLGAGAMGSVYRATDIRFDDRDVALKFMAASQMASETAWKRMLNEARVTSELDHPNIVRIYDHTLTKFGPCLVLEYVPGSSLRELVGTMTDDLSRVVDIVRQMASAIAAAHEKGVIHRDIKPDNVILRPDGVVKVMDFGIARVAGSDRLSQSGPVMTLVYAAPEQQKEDAINQSDLFAIGCVFYELLTGSHAFWKEGLSDYAVMSRMQEGKHQPIPSTAGMLATLLESLLAADPARRPRTAADLVAMLEQWRSATRIHLKTPAPSYGAPAVPLGSGPAALPNVRRYSVQPGDSGVVEIFLTRNVFDDTYDLAELLGKVAGGGRCRVIGKTLLGLLSQNDTLRTALEQGVRIELALVDPHGGEELFKKIPDVHIDDLAPAARHFASIARWAAEARPAGSFEVRYHDEAIIDSFTEYDGPLFRRAVWELSFGQSRNSKRVFVLDPGVAGIGQDVAARYQKVWENAKVQFHYAGKEVRTELPRDLHEHGEPHPRKKVEVLPEETPVARREFDIRPAMSSDMEWMASLERKYFKRAGIPASRLMEWFDANPHGFWVVSVRGGAAIGFLNLLPIRQEPFDRFKKGTMVERDIRKSMIYRPSERESVRELYGECLVIDRHQTLALRYLLSHIHQLMRRVCIPERVQKVYALAATEQGDQFLTHLSFKPHRKGRPRQDGLRLYDISMFDLVLSCARYLEQDPGTGR